MLKWEGGVLGMLYDGKGEIKKAKSFFYRVIKS